MIDIRKITTLQGFAALKEEWDMLLRHCPSDTIFLTWEWVYNWWTVYGAGSGRSLLILLARKQGRLVGIAPMYAENNALPSGRTLRFLGSSFVGSDYLDFIVSPEAQKDVLAAFISHLDAIEKDWDYMIISDIPEKSTTIEFLNGLKTFHVLTKPHSKCPYITLPRRWDALMKSFGSSLRYDINRKLRRFADAHIGSFMELKDAEEINGAFEKLMELNKNRFKEKGINSPFEDPRFEAFHKKLISDLCKKDMVRLFFLTVDSVPIACMYAFKYRNRYLYYQGGFDTEWGDVSPGVLMFSHVIKDAILKGADEFDFLKGEEEYKFRWTDQTRNNLKLMLFRKTVKNNMLYFIMNFKKQLYK